MTFYKFKATVKHDYGTFTTDSRAVQSTVTINVVAQSEDAARETICQVESCPPRAIKHITQGEEL